MHNRIIDELHSRAIFWIDIYPSIYSIFKKKIYTIYLKIFVPWIKENYSAEHMTLIYNTKTTHNVVFLTFG